MGQQGSQHGGGGDAAGEGCLAERSQPLSDGADSGQKCALAAHHNHFYLHPTAALWHQRCELHEIHLTLNGKCAFPLHNQTSF